MVIRRDSDRTPEQVFEEFSAEGHDLEFARTVFPVQLARYEGDRLVSRSQAKRLLSRGDRFREILLDFAKVESIGPAFADEVFRVYRSAHPDVHLDWSNANPKVEAMIQRALRRPADGENG